MRTRRNTTRQIFLLIAAGVVALTLFGRIGLAQEADPHADTSRECLECHAMHYRLSYDYQGNPAPALGDSGPYTHLLRTDAAAPAPAAATTARAAGATFRPLRGKLPLLELDRARITIYDQAGLPLERILRQALSVPSSARRAGTPQSVLVRANGEMLYSDGANSALTVLDVHGTPVQQVWAGDLLGLPRERVHPTSLALDAAGNVYLAVAGEVQAVLALTPDLRLAAEITRTPATGSAFDAISGLWVDAAGIIYTMTGPGGSTRAYLPDGRPAPPAAMLFGLPCTVESAGLQTDAYGSLWTVERLVPLEAPAAARATPQQDVPRVYVLTTPFGARSRSTHGGALR